MSLVKQKKEDDYFLVTLLCVLRQFVLVRAEARGIAKGTAVGIGGTACQEL